MARWFMAAGAGARQCNCGRTAMCLATAAQEAICTAAISVDSLVCLGVSGTEVAGIQIKNIFMDQWLYKIW